MENNQIKIDVNDVIESLTKQIAEYSQKFAILEATLKQKDKLIHELQNDTFEIK